MKIDRKPIPGFARDALKYDAATGVITWAIRRPTVQVGDVAGTVDRSGYRRIRILGTEYAAHRVAWFLHTAEQPPDIIDHADGDLLNNGWENLRAADCTLNMANRRSTGRLKKGVRQHRGQSKFFAQIKCAGRLYYLGSFETEDDAHEAYIAKARELFGEFARAA